MSAIYSSFCDQLPGENDEKTKPVVMKLGDIMGFIDLRRALQVGASPRTTEMDGGTET